MIIIANTVRIVLAVLLPATLLLSGCGNSTSSESVSTVNRPGSEQVAKGHSEVITYENSQGKFRAVVYVPEGYSAKVALPLVVMVHGCDTSAEEQQATNLFDPLADRKGFIVAYPDHDTASALSLGTHPLQCWQFYDPTEGQRSGGDVDGIVGLTHKVMSRWSVDSERVYLAGMSSGAYLATFTAASFPDIFAAVAISAGGPYGGIYGNSLPIIEGVPTETLADMAYEAMGPNARVMPLLGFHGDADMTVSPATGDKAITQSIMTNNLVVSGSNNAPFPLTTTDVLTETVPGGRTYDDLRYFDKDGCLIARQLRIHGMGHFWPGGSAAPELAKFTDALAPNGAEISWDFFRRYTKSGTGLPCTETR